MSTGCIDRRKHKKIPPHLNHPSKHTIGFQGVTSSEEGKPILLDPDPAKYWHNISTVPLGPYSRVLKVQSTGSGFRSRSEPLLRRSAPIRRVTLIDSMDEN